MTCGSSTLASSACATSTIPRLILAAALGGVCPPQGVTHRGWPPIIPSPFRCLVIDVAADEIIARRLSKPHSPGWHEGGSQFRTQTGASRLASSESAGSLSASASRAGPQSGCNPRPSLSSWTSLLTIT
jgi:hypothetical protein